MAIPASALLQTVTPKLPSKRPPLFPHSIPYPLSLRKSPFIDNAVDKTTGTIRLKGTFDNRDRRLWPGQFVDVVLTLTTEQNRVVVPTQAVQSGQQGQHVYMIKDDMSTELRIVAVERTYDKWTVV